MIKKIAWETFKNTGDINSFMELKQIENIERKMEKIIEQETNGIKETVPKDTISNNINRYQ